MHISQYAYTEHTPTNNQGESQHTQGQGRVLRKHIKGRDTLLCVKMRTLCEEM
jgi:hypothetical protein